MAISELRAPSGRRSRPSGGTPRPSRGAPNAYFDFNEFFWQLKVKSAPLTQTKFFSLIYCAERLDDGEACFHLAEEFDNWFINLLPLTHNTEGDEKRAIQEWAKKALAWKPFAEYLYRKAIYIGCDEAALHLAFLCQELHRADERLWWEHAIHNCNDRTAMGELALWFLRPENKDIDRAIYWFQQAFRVDGPYVDALGYIEALQERGTPQDVREAISVLTMLVNPESNLSNDLTDSSELPAWINQKEIESEIVSTMPDSYVYQELVSESWFTLEGEEDDYMCVLYLTCPSSEFLGPELV